MKVLFAVNNEDVSESIVKKYQKNFKEIISYKNVYYFNAILKEIQKDKSYDRIVISEDLEQFTNTSYEQMDKFLFEKLDSISDEALNAKGSDIPIILICTERRSKSEDFLVKLFGIGIYNAIVGNDRSIDEVCRLICKPRLKKEAKTYYQIDSEHVSYKSENENEVSEVELQNILAHFKMLGKSEAKYVESYDKIATQYNDNQLKVISRGLPLNVRAVLEEKSPKYQQVMAFNKSVSDSLRNKKNSQNSGLSEKLLVNAKKAKTIENPIVIPKSMNTAENAKKLTRKVNKTPASVEKVASNAEPKSQVSHKLETKQVVDSVKPVTDNNDDESTDVVGQVAETAAPKRGRGRPRKNPVPEEVDNTPKRGRGRPRKNPLPEEIEPIEVVEPIEELNPIDEIDEKFDKIDTNIDVTNNEDTSMDSVIETIDANLLDDENEPNDENMQEDGTINEEQTKKVYSSPNIPGMFDEEDEDEEELIVPEYNKNEFEQASEAPKSDPIITEPVRPTRPAMSEANISGSVVNYSYSENIHVDLSGVLQGNKKIVSVVGTSKNGTSFIVNNLAEMLSSTGVNVAILDTTQNRNSYYIYTKNEEDLRRTAMSSITNLANGIASGIRVNNNLAVYTSLPNEDMGIENVQTVLETLIKSHTIVLIDCDFNTPKGYFSAAQEIYLVQTMDVLTIQPLTAFLKELVAQNILEESKIRVIINKFVKIRGITEREIIGGMAYYNDPAMTYQTGLFDKSTVRYLTIPFEEEIYTKYLQGLINCEISLKGYSKTFMQTLKQLSNMVYPMVSTGKTGYRPPALSNKGNDTFSASMNNTLDQMKRNY